MYGLYYQKFGLQVNEIPVNYTKVSKCVALEKNRKNWMEKSRSFVNEKKKALLDRIQRT